MRGPLGVARIPEEESALSPEEWTLRNMRTGCTAGARPQSRSPSSSCFGQGDAAGPLQTCLGARHGAGVPGHGCPSCRGLPQFAGGTGDPLILPEVSEASTEAADLFHIGTGHPSLLAICQADPLQPAWGHTGQGQHQWHQRDTRARSARELLGPDTSLVCTPGAKVTSSQHLPSPGRTLPLAVL